MSGYLAEPLKQYPNAQWLQELGTWSYYIATYPFLLPNLVAVLLCLISFVTVIFWVEETLPDHERRGITRIPYDIFVYMYPCMNCDGQEEALKVKNCESTALLANGNRPTSSTEVKSFIEPSKQQPKIWSKVETRRHILLYAVFSFVGSAVDDAFPLFCISHKGGLSLSEAQIGKVLSSAGLLFASLQYTTFSTIIEKFGLHSALKFGSILGNPLVILIPVSLILNRSAKFDGDMTLSTYIFLTIVMAICKIFSTLFFATLAISVNKTVPRSQRARMNGLNMVCGSIGKALGPTFAGCLVSFCLSSGFIQPLHGSILVFVVLSSVGAVTVIQTWKLHKTGRENQTLP